MTIALSAIEGNSIIHLWSASGNEITIALSAIEEKFHHPSRSAS